MTGKPMTDEDWDNAAFMEALRRFPHPVPMLDDGVACPWCGCPHATVRFDELNECDECHRGFAFGVPPWGDDREAMSWVPFPNHLWRSMGLAKRPQLLPMWEPNDRLKKLYNAFGNGESKGTPKLSKFERMLADPSWHNGQIKQ